MADRETELREQLAALDALPQDVKDGSYINGHAVTHTWRDEEGKLASKSIDPEDFYAAMKDCLGSKPEDGPFQPIETAPMDGTPLLLRARAKNATAEATVIGWYLPEHGWIELAFYPNQPVGIVPSAWMHLP